MIPTSTIVAMSISVLLCFGVPIAFCVYFIATKKSCMRAVFLGVATFLIVQTLLRAPLTSLMLASDSLREWLTNPWCYALFIAITSAIFKEGGRYLGIRFTMKETCRFVDGVAFGVGFSGASAILLTGLSDITYFITAIRIQAGGYDALAGYFSAEQATEVVNYLTQTPWTEFFFSGLDCVVWMVPEIALSVLVLLAIIRKKQGFPLLFIAFAAHFFMEGAVGILYNVFHLNVYLVNAYLAILAIVAIAFLYYLSKRDFFPKKLEIKRAELRSPLL